MTIREPDHFCAYNVSGVSPLQMRGVERKLCGVQWDTQRYHSSKSCEETSSCSLHINMMVSRKESVCYRGWKALHKCSQNEVVIMTTSLFPSSSWPSCWLQAAISASSQFRPHETQGVLTALVVLPPTSSVLTSDRL